MAVRMRRRVRCIVGLIVVFLLHLLIVGCAGAGTSGPQLIVIEPSYKNCGVQVQGGTAREWSLCESAGFTNPRTRVLSFVVK